MPVWSPWTSDHLLNVSDGLHPWTQLATGFGIWKWGLGTNSLRILGTSRILLKVELLRCSPRNNVFSFPHLLTRPRFRPGTGSEGPPPVPALCSLHHPTTTAPCQAPIWNHSNARVSGRSKLRSCGAPLQELSHLLLPPSTPPAQCSGHLCPPPTIMVGPQTPFGP